MAKKSFPSSVGQAAFAPGGTAQQTATGPVTRALALYKGGKYKQVIALCQPVAPDNRQYADAQQLLGLAMDKMGDSENAVVHLVQAAKLDSGNSLLQSSLAGVLARLGRVDEAVNAHEAALASDPTNTYALYGLGRIAEGQGKIKPAIRYYRKVLDHDPEDLRHGAQLRLTHLGARTMPPRTPLSYMRQFYADRARAWRNPSGKNLSRPREHQGPAG